MTMQVLELLPNPRLIKFEGKYQIIKAEGRRLIGGYASVEVKDTQGETITLEALKGALTPFMAAKLYRNVHVMHSNIEVGKVIDLITDSEGYLWETKVDDLGLFAVCEIDRPIKEADRVWEAIERGELTAFSIAGEAIHRTGEHGEIIDQLELFEITICFKGANPGAKFVMIKAVPSIEIPACVACRLQKSVAVPTVFTRNTDGKRFLVFPSQVRKDEAGTSDAVSVLEKRTSETKESEQTMGEEKTEPTAGTPAAPPTGAAAPTTTSPAQSGAEKIDMQKLLEFDAHLVKLIDLLEQVKASAQAEKTGEAEKTEKDTSLSPIATGAPPPPSAVVVAPSLSDASVQAIVKMVKDEIVKVYPPEKRTLVPNTGAPGEVEKLDLDKVAKMPWNELENYHAERLAKIRGGLQLP